MKRMRTFSRKLLFVIPLLIGSGCFLDLNSDPKLSVNPGSITLESTADVATLRIRNTGGGTLQWSIEEVVRANGSSPWTSGDVPWFMIGAPGETVSDGITTVETDHVQLTAEAGTTQVGILNNAGVRITQTGGDAVVIVVPISLIVQSTVRVTPETLTLATDATTGSFEIVNEGELSVPWEILFLTDPLGNTGDPLPSDITVRPSAASTSGGSRTRVSLEWAAGRTDFRLLVSFNNGAEVRVVQVLFGQEVTGLVVSPTPLVLFNDPGAGGTQVPSDLTISNTDSVPVTWTITLENLAAPGDTVPITVSSLGATTPADASTDISIAITETDNILLGEGNYSIRITTVGGGGLIEVPIIVEALSLPVIAVSEEPDPNVALPPIVDLRLLDFGRELIQLEFWIANVGSNTSRLFFNIRHEDEGVEHPLIILVNPTRGSAEGEDNDYWIIEQQRHVDGIPITVTVNRSNLTEDVETREITIEAMDAEFGTVIAGVEPVTVTVRVERPPLKIEGALNRSRPPYVTRFVFLLRDSLGEVIPTVTASDRERIAFNIAENDIALDPDEINQFVTGPENLKVNLVLMLDFTGSMYMAGTSDPLSPLAPGEALEQVIDAAKEFLDDIPKSYQVALMFYNDRQQQDRLLHTFSTDRASLKDALDQFSLPPSRFGVSDIRDAVLDAIDLLAAEDPPETLPFDEADLRAVLFISDGDDNASFSSLSQVTDSARDTKVRLYPLGYNPSEAVNSADLLVMAEETGGHLYSAGSVQNLANLLDNDTGFSFGNNTGTGTNSALFDIENKGDTLLSWSISGHEEISWITDLLPSAGNLSAGGASTVTVRIDPTQIAADTKVAAELTVDSNLGMGLVRIEAEVDGSNVLVGATVQLRDEPGVVWSDLRNQIVLTYITPSQGSGTYTVNVRYEEDDGDMIEGTFEEDGEFFPGDVLAGQLSMRTTGIIYDPTTTDPAIATRAEFFVHTDYVPRGVNRFSMRFFMDVPSDIADEELFDLKDAIADLRANAVMTVALAEDGLLIPEDVFAPTWRLIEQSDGVYVMLTEQDNPLPYGAFGNLLKVTITNIAGYVDAFNAISREPEFFIGMRVDNEIYVSPATPGRISETMFFLYPGGPTFPDRQLSITTTPDVAPPADNPVTLANPGILPEDPGAWDADGDGVPDFEDSALDNELLPGNIANPNPAEINGDENALTIVLTNDGLSSFHYELDLATVPDWIVAINGAPTSEPVEGDLSRGDTFTLEFEIDRMAPDPDLGLGFENEILILNTDRPEGPEEIPLTLITDNLDDI